MELSADIEFITRYEDEEREYYVFKVNMGGHTRMVTMTEEDLEDEP